MTKGRSDKRKSSEEDQEVTRTLLSELEDEWLTARIRGDSDSTKRILDEIYQGCNSDGLAQSKADFVGFVESSRGPYTQGDHIQRSIQVHGDMAISTGVVTLRSVDRQNQFRYLRVYRKHAGEWRLIASQSTRLRPA